MIYALVWLTGALTASCFWGAWQWHEYPDLCGWLIVSGALFLALSVVAAMAVVTDEK